nr:hypothetical protein [Veronia pacifica]
MPPRQAVLPRKVHGPVRLPLWHPMVGLPDKLVSDPPDHDLVRDVQRLTPIEPAQPLCCHLPNGQYQGMEVTGKVRHIEGRPTHLLPQLQCRHRSYHLSNLMQYCHPLPPCDAGASGFVRSRDAVCAIGNLARIVSMAVMASPLWMSPPSQR